MSKPNDGCVRTIHFRVSSRNLYRTPWLSSPPQLPGPFSLRCSTEAAERPPAARFWTQWFKPQSLGPVGLWLLMIMSIPFAASPAWAASESVESTDLRVAVTTDPYSFCVTEKVTGERLVCEDSVVFSLGPELYPVSKASNLRKASQGLEAELPLELAGRDPLRPGAPDRARVWFTFVEPSVLRVEVSYEGASQ